MEPVRIPRPHHAGEETRPRPASTDEMRAFFGAEVRYTPKGEG